MRSSTAADWTSGSRAGGTAAVGVDNRRRDGVGPVGAKANSEWRWSAEPEAESLRFERATGVRPMFSSRPRLPPKARARQTALDQPAARLARARAPTHARWADVAVNLATVCLRARFCSRCA